MLYCTVVVGHSEDHATVQGGTVTQEETMNINQYQYQLTQGQNSFRGTGEDWNALGNNAQVKQSVDSIAVTMSGGNGRNAG